MDDHQLQMARGCYGYGNWKARYWFLGPEQGMSKDEEELKLRVSAWIRRGSPDLDDCREFHCEIGEKRWHGCPPLKKAILQKTWAKLMLVMMAAEDRLEYQVEHWGSLRGETCVIELSGLAANSQQVERSHEEFLDERIANINCKMREHKPQFLFLYGKGRKGSSEVAWNKLTQESEDLEKQSTFAKIRRCGPTLVVWAPHPQKRRTNNQDWLDLGATIRRLSSAHWSTRQVIGAGGNMEGKQ